MFQVCGRRESMHPDRNPQPIEEIRQRIGNLQFPHRQESRRAKQHAQDRIRNKRPHAHKKLRRKIVGVFVNNINRGILKLEKTDVVNLQAEKPTKEKMPRFVHDHAWESQNRNHNSWNKEHTRSYFLPFSALRNLLSYSFLLMICRLSIRWRIRGTYSSICLVSSVSDCGIC